jgi:hypothetical protein
LGNEGVDDDIVGNRNGEGFKSEGIGWNIVSRGQQGQPIQNRSDGEVKVGKVQISGKRVSG